MVSPGQLLLAIPFAAAKEFLFKRQCQPSHCPQHMGGDVGEGKSLSAAVRLQLCVPVLSHHCGTTPLLVDSYLLLSAQAASDIKQSKQSFVTVQAAAQS